MLNWYFEDNFHADGDCDSCMLLYFLYVLLFFFKSRDVDKMLNFVGRKRISAFFFQIER
jgi:hypothetical protein